LGVTFISGYPPATYSLTVNAANGSVSKTPNQSSYYSGRSVTLTAAASAGYQFSSWSGDVTGTTNPVTIIMDSNKTVTANFIISAEPSVPERTQLEVYNNALKGAGAQASIKLMLAEPGNATVKIYDSKGKEMLCLFDGYKAAGTYDLIWAGVDSGGSKAGSGVYMVYFKANGIKQTKKIVVVR
jgi:uncharacterized repeat protein (TIGR02543 family)